MIGVYTLNPNTICIYMYSMVSASGLAATKEQEKKKKKRGLKG